MTSITPCQNYRGLSNQGATCYMNSLLQSLYMTPEFRRKLYSWKYDPSKEGEKKDSIPYQLQLLFGKLQLSSLPFIETKSLTRSFGWEMRESFQQHDVQEFCRVLFDAIEQSVKGSWDENMINRMFEGKMTDYVRCFGCGNESKRSDRFLDLSLTVWNEFDKVYNDTLEKALYDYIRPTKLDEDNKYFCETCGLKQDALKGLKFEEFPYLLVLQLKRFDLDYTTFQRKKLNQKVTFPQVLNLNPYLTPQAVHYFDSVAAPDSVEEEKQETPQLEVKPKGLDSTTLSSLSAPELTYSIPDKDKTPLKLDDFAYEKLLEKQAQDRKLQQKRQIEAYIEQGEYVYELFSVMIHSGSALGGHYYAYIKSFESGKWFNFNDCRVTEIQEKEIEKVFGGSQTNWGHSATAYLLMYRKVTPENLDRVEDTEVPDYIVEDFASEKEKDQKTASEQLEKYKTLSFKVYHNKESITVTAKKDELFKAVKEKAIEEFKLKEDPENIRVRGYSVYYDTLQDVYDENKTIEVQSIWNFKVMGVEVKTSQEEWQTYDPNCITIKVNLWNDSYWEDKRPLEEKVNDSYKLAVNKTQSFLELMETFSEKFGIPVESQMIIKKSMLGSNCACEVLSHSYNYEKNLTFTRIYEGTVLFLEKVDSESNWLKLIEEERKRLKLRFNHPDQTSIQTEYSYSTVLHESTTVGALKEVISETLGISAEELVIRKGSKHCEELKDKDASLKEARITHQMAIHTERGVPTKPHEYRVQFFFAEFSGENEADAICYKYFELFKIPVNGCMKVHELKAFLCEKVKEIYPSMQLNPEKLRLREKTSDKLTRVLKDSEQLNNYTMFDRKNLALVDLDEKEKPLEDNEILINIRRWFPSTWDISKPKEIIVKKNDTMEVLGKVISEAFQIQEENLQITKITYNWNFSRLDLKPALYYKAYKYKALLCSSPFYLNIDGILLFVKDSSEEVKTLSEEERSKFDCKKNTYNYSSTLTWKYEPPKERSIKINVKKNQE